ncbi:MAG TPA: alpha/beta hydrolase [Pseudomonadota bacterium]|nr:alpha/beta hydrolase [Pseudomonadota bacterium]
MPRAKSNGIEIEYETLGDPAGAPVLLIMGLGAQLVRWPEAFCQALVQAGHYVIRFDNRDVGLSSKMSGRAPILRSALLSAVGIPADLPYTLYDMAEDARGLLDALSVPTAHVIGASMGGMIGQLLCAQHPDRVRCFVSIMSSSGDRSLPGPRLDIRLRLLRRAPAKDRAARVEHVADLFRRIGSPGYPIPIEDLRARSARELDRCDYPAGFLRQVAAIVGSPSRLALLSRIRAPTLIIHGAADPLVPVAAAHDLGRRIPGAAVEIVDGMGHDMPPPILPRLTERILTHLRTTGPA